MNFAMVLRHHAAYRGEYLALEDGRVRLTYRELWSLAVGLAERLTARGLEPGQPVVVLSENSAAMALLYAGVMLGGGAFAPLNYRLSEAEIANLVEMTKPAMCVVDDSHSSRFPVTAHLLEELLEGLPIDRMVTRFVEGCAEDPNNILFTSGTSGLPKGALLTHANIFASCANVCYHQAMTSSDGTLIVLPLYHTAALHLQLTPTWYCGGHALICEKWDPDQAAALMSRDSITTSFLLPEQWRDVIRIMKRPHQLRLAVTGGAPLDDEVLDGTQRFFGRPPAFIMGMTEVSPQIAFMTPDETRKKNGAIGRPSLWADIRIVDETLQPVRDGDVGEMCIKGPLVLDSYWCAPEETAAAFDADGYFHGGDLVRMDADGFITIVDRKKDVIRSGGENVFSVEVERVLQQHPAIQEVAVVGRKHDRWGEGVAAVVVLRPGCTLTLEGIQDFCRARLARYKKPVFLEIVDTLPRNLTGKVLKTGLRQWLNDRPITAQ